MDEVLKVVLSTGGTHLAVTGLVNSENKTVKDLISLPLPPPSLSLSFSLSLPLIPGNDSPVLISVYALPIDAWLQQVGGDQVHVL